MIAVPIAVVLFGYWVLYAGLKRASLADAWNCAPQQQQTAGDQSGRRPGDISVTAPGGTRLTVSTNCTVRKGDTKLPIPGTGQYMIWRPLPLPFGGAALAQLNGQLLGPCSG